MTTGSNPTILNKISWITSFCPKRSWQLINNDTKPSSHHWQIFSTPCEEDGGCGEGNRHKTVEGGRSDGEMGHCPTLSQSAIESCRTLNQPWLPPCVHNPSKPRTAHTHLTLQLPPSLNQPYYKLVYQHTLSFIYELLTYTPELNYVATILSLLPKHHIRHALNE